jgi:hypothetical protein
MAGKTLPSKSAGKSTKGKAALPGKKAVATLQPRKRVLEWMDALRKAGGDQNAVKKVFNRVRDDRAASKVDRDHFYRALAQQGLVWFVGALEGRVLKPDEVKQLARRFAEHRGA